MLLQYRNIGKIITLYMVSAVEGLMFIRTLASNLILEILFCTFFQIGSIDLGFYQVLSQGIHIYLIQYTIYIVVRKRYNPLVNYITYLQNYMNSLTHHISVNICPIYE